MCFCETPRRGLVAQPANTFSNLGFVAVGLAIAAAVDRRRVFAARRNPLNAWPFYGTTFAVVTALLGPGSMFLHGSLTRWGGRVDVASMYLYASLLVAYASLRLFHLSRARFAALFAALFGALLATALLRAVRVEPLFGLLLATVVALELRIRRRPGHRIEMRWLLAAGACFGLAFAIWVPSLSGGALCDPGSWLQGHGAWHLLCAAAAGCLFVYLRSEDAAAPAPARPDASAPPRNTSRNSTATPTTMKESARLKVGHS